MKLVLIAPSGGGKGSLAEDIVRDFGVAHISTGEMFRANIDGKTKIGLEAAEYVSKGLWVPDELTTRMLQTRISQPDCKNGFILDGYPRTLPQARSLATLTDIDLAIDIAVSDEIVIERLLARGRADDTREIIQNRLDSFHKGIEPVREFYNAQGKLAKIFVEKDTSKADVYNAFLEILKRNENL